ncbi:amidohydrolase family protein [Aestuariivita sp.]|jgi:predicted TIM-barrel fold metal-dependent hydrolase|uniref:amidohydrolase family protein n=1 Tax=Aestuariivita sp. TaxID=1872407 RepID=UPI002173BC0A|nr:amidohydrolase family protein [Aestuariivita sp.]MCE8006110.1 amidohydrolase [Aestuariivita sp.]
MDNVRAIDAVVNIWTEDALAGRPDRREFYTGKMNVDDETFTGISLDDMLHRMDRAGIEKSMLIAAKVGPKEHRACYHVPYDIVYDAARLHPDRFLCLAGIDPTEGMTGVRALEEAVRDKGFVGAHLYPHWFELAPDHARYYPFYAKCVELDIPIQMQVGQSMVYDKSFPRRSVGRPITLDSVACDFPELRIIGIHIGIPWTDEMIAMAWKHENVFIGSDAHAPRYWPESFVHYINTFGQDKVLFGTDFPVLDFERTMEQINALDLRPEPKRKLLRDNAIRVYKLRAER